LFQADYYGSLKHAEDLALRQGINQSTLENKSFHKKLLGSLDNRLQQISTNSNLLTGALADDSKQTQQAISSVSVEVEAMRGQIHEDMGLLNEGLAGIEFSIYSCAEYLGNELREISFQLNSLVETNQELLHVLLESLDNESRQYFQQGQQCFESQEYEMARERFQKALLADTTNPYAHEYLGFVSVQLNEIADATRHFELTTKFARTPPAQAKAFSHLARALLVTGRKPEAVTAIRTAIELESHTAAYHFELATCLALSGESEGCLTALATAIDLDPHYWLLAIDEASFEPLSDAVVKLLSEIKSYKTGKSNTLHQMIMRCLETAGSIKGLEESLLQSIVTSERDDHQGLFSGTGDDLQKVMEITQRMSGMLQSDSIIKAQVVIDKCHWIAGWFREKLSEDRQSYFELIEGAIKTRSEELQDWIKKMEEATRALPSAYKHQEAQLRLKQQEAESRIPGTHKSRPDRIDGWFSDAMSGDLDAIGKFGSFGAVVAFCLPLFWLGGWGLLLSPFTAVAAYFLILAIGVFGTMIRFNSADRANQERMEAQILRLKAENRQQQLDFKERIKKEEADFSEHLSRLTPHPRKLKELSAELEDNVLQLQQQDTEKFTGRPFLS
jgi:tetratricopeptide (TPR) repeat protein